MAWDERYRKGDHADLAPMPFIEALAARTAPGSLVLDLACGAGRHSRLFAAQGCQVIAVDSSSVAIDLVLSRDPGIRALVRAAEEFAFAENAFDVVIVTMFLDRSLFPKLRAAAKPGGRVAMAIPLEDPRKGVKPMNPDFLLKPGELAAQFASPCWTREHCAESRPDPPARAVAQLIARKL